MKTLWAVACAVIAVAGAFVLGGCASTKTQIADFSEMKVGDGPGDTLRRLTELQKTPGDQTSAVSSPKASSSSKSPTGSIETASSKVTVVSDIPPAKPSEPSRKEDPQSSYLSRLDDIVKNKTTNRSMASSSGATTEAKTVREIKTEDPPISAPSPTREVPPSENTESGGRTISRQASGGQTRPAAALPASTAGKAASSPDTQYRIGREDVLHITVWGNEGLTMDVIVRPDGKISMPLIQDIQADGFTASELAVRIRNDLLAYIKDPNVSVVVKEINAPKFSVIGYVNKPGTYPMRGDVTVLQALAEAGGFTPFASPRKLKLVRNAGGKKEVRLINYYDMIDKDGEGSLLLKAGDTIVVP